MLRAQYRSFGRGDRINSWRARTPEEQQGRDGGREGDLKCWAPAVNSSCFCFRVINVPLNRARAWAPVSAAFNAISSPYWTGLGAAGGGLYFLPSPLNEVMRVLGRVAWGAGGRAEAGGTHPSPTGPVRSGRGEHVRLLPREPPGEPPAPSRLRTLLTCAAEAGERVPPPQRPSARSPLPPRAPLAPELDTFPLRSQTSPSPRPLTEQSFIKLFHALSGRGAPGDGGLFRPFVGAPQDRPA